MGLFSSSSKKSYSTAVNKTIDARVGVEGGGVGIGAGATVGGGGLTTSVSDMGNLSQSFEGASFTTGLTGPDIVQLMEAQGEISRQSADASGRLADLALTSLSAAKVGQSVDWKQYIPIAIVGVVMIAAQRRRA